MMMMSASLTHLMSTPSCYGVRQNSSAHASCSSSYREVVIKRRFQGLAYPVSFTCAPHRISCLGGLGHKKVLRIPIKLQRLQRIDGVSKEGMVIRAGFKNKVKKAVRNLERSLQDGKLEELEDELPQLAIALPLGLVSFEALFMVGWVSSLRGLLPGTRGFFSAGDLILCSIMLANCIVGWYALEHSRSELNSLPREKWWSKLKVSQPGIIDYGFSLARGLIPFANLFVWLRLARRQEHLSARAKAGMVANAWVYGGPPLFTLLLLLNGGWSVFFQIGLVSNVALILGALHLPFEEARVKNEKVLMEVAKTKRSSGKLKGKDPKPVPKEISVEEKERIQRLKELEEFDMLLAQSSPREKSVLPGKHDSETHPIFCVAANVLWGFTVLREIRGLTLTSASIASLLKPWQMFFPIASTIKACQRPCYVQVTCQNSA